MKNLILTISLLFLVGCGSSSGESDVVLQDVDNSIRTTKSTSLGYYGESVIFGNHLASQWWTMTYQGDTERFLLQSNGDGVDGEDIGTGYYFNYGVSKDGKRLNRNNEMIFYIKKATSSRCYNVDLTGEGEDGRQITVNITMCADGV